VRSPAIRHVVPDIDQEEKIREPEPFTDVYLLAVPMPTYKALSDAAAKRNMTVAKLITLAFNKVLEDGHG
jgi:hypothetical protein